MPGRELSKTAYGSMEYTRHTWELLFMTTRNDYFAFDRPVDTETEQKGSLAGKGMKPMPGKSFHRCQTRGT